MATDRFEQWGESAAAHAAGDPSADESDEPEVRPGSVLSIDVQEAAGTVALILTGDLDTYTTPAFVERVRRYDPVKVQLVIDLTRVGLLDSAGLASLLSVRNRAHRDGARLGLVCPDRRLVRLFWFTGLRPAFVFGDDLDAVQTAIVAGRAEPVARGATRPR